MSDPRSWLVIEAMAARLKLIRQVNGYRTDAGENVSAEPLQEDGRRGDFYLVPLLEGTRRGTDPAKAQGNARAATYAVMAMIKAERRGAQKELHFLLADIDQAFAKTAEAMKGFPPGGGYPRFNSSELLPRQDGSKWIGAIVRFDTEYNL